MEEQLRTLVQMQKLDDRIGALRVLQKELPQQLNEIIGHVDQATANLLACETERAELAKKQRSLESDIKQHQEQIKKYSNQLSEIKTNKEYKANRNWTRRKKLKANRKANCAARSTRWKDRSRICAPNATPWHAPCPCRS